MEERFRSDDLQLACHLARPETRLGPGEPGVVLCHGFPLEALGARRSAHTFPELCDRIASQMGWFALTFNFRGCGPSEGDFSLAGWLDDLAAAVAHLREGAPVDRVWLAGTGAGGSLSIVLAADDPTIEGVATLGARADFDDWGAQPRRFLEHAREIGAVRDANFPRSFETWSRELRALRPLEAVRRLAPRPLLVLHGDDDDVVPVAEARGLAATHGDAELRVLVGGGHRLRHDPRAVAVLLGWLERERARAAA